MHTSPHATFLTSRRPTSLLRPPWPEPRWLDHPQVHPVLTRPALVQTMRRMVRMTLHKSDGHRASHAAVRATMVPPTSSLDFPLYGPPLALPRTTLNPVDSSQIPMNSPLAEAIQETIKIMRKVECHA
ncbi:hypothetical protein F511_10434 [Dorcoceras hygrometricum]|uniref:Uncharacterized protein n=1 Tax=Dorcoceras hygrometricum TaxID=472368 RepID=A0A2Z7C7B2_9LAMI|nr:hypothetical protein F511_10434 [Dorcoceras hygrometricum]